MQTSALHHAASIRLESLLKLNDVKVTGAPAASLAAAAAAATSPRRRSGEHRLAGGEQQQDGDAAADGPAARQANGTSAAAEAAPPPVKTLLEFVAWVVLQQEVAEADGSRGIAGRTRSSSAAAAEALARTVRSGFLAQQLPDLALAVRRMQTGGWQGPAARTGAAAGPAVAGAPWLMGPALMQLAGAVLN